MNPEDEDKLFKYYNIDKNNLIEKIKRSNHRKKVYLPEEKMCFVCPECGKEKRWERFRFKNKNIENMNLVCEDCHKNV